MYEMRAYSRVCSIGLLYRPTCSGLLDVVMLLRACSLYDTVAVVVCLPINDYYY